MRWCGVAPSPTERAVSVISSSRAAEAQDDVSEARRGQTSRELGCQANSLLILLGMVGPGDVLVVGPAGLEAAVQDAGEAVAELAQGGVVAGAAGAECVVVGPAPGEARSVQKACWCRASARRS